MLTVAVVTGALAATAHAESYYLIVGGIGGETQYEERFLAQVDSLASASRRTLGDDSLVTVLSGDGATREALTAELDRLADSTSADDSVAIFLLGHGSHDGEIYKFNIPGPDIDGDGFAELLNAIPADRQLVVNATSASGAVLETWAGDNRLLVTATRSGGERNATRFGDYWAEAMSSDEADANKNGAITVQEAFEFAERKVADSYEGAGNLATEHPQLVGDTAGSFNVALLEARIATTAELEELIGELTVLEEQIEILRAQREEMDNDVYLGQLQDLLLELALVQREIDEIRDAE
ncbi:MAG: C13 family peptidase [Gammaproteobacteria bacterium]